MHADLTATKRGAVQIWAKRRNPARMLSRLKHLLTQTAISMIVPWRTDVWLRNCLHLGRLIEQRITRAPRWKRLTDTKL